MTNIYCETLLREYFSCNAALGLNYNRKAVFFGLGAVFCLQERDIVDLFGLTENPAIREIVTDDDYKRYKRIEQYGKLIGGESAYSDAEKAIIAIKGDAVTAIAAAGLIADGNSSQNKIVTTLTDCAESGSVLALKILGFLQCEGILVGKDEQTGVKNLEKAMRWGDVGAAFGMLKYSRTDKTEILKTLNAVVKNTPYEFMQQIAEKAYGISVDGKCAREALLIKQAINADKIKKGVYDSMIARVVYADSIGIKDKEKILFSETKESLSETCDLPLRLKFSDISVDKDAACAMPLSREAEVKNVLRSLSDSDLRATDSFRPTCLCSDSEYVAEIYADVVRAAFKNARVEKIDAADLREFDVSPDKNNVFLRNIDERVGNVCLISMRGDVPDYALEAIKAVLSGNRRKNFRLVKPSVTLDISSVLPVCVCDSENAKK